MNRDLRLWKKAWPKMLLAIAVLGSAAQGLAESLDAGPKDLELKATVVRKGGMANVIFQPVNAAGPVDVYDAKGSRLGQLSWQALFEVQVRESTLKESMTPAGIDIQKLLRDIGAVSTVDGQALIKADLPFSVRREDGTEVSAGDTVYFRLANVLSDRKIEPVGAYAPPQADKASTELAREFNDKLLEDGVQGSVPEQARPAPKKKHSHDVHAGIPNTPLVEPREVKDPYVSENDRFLSAPTCDCARGACNQSSYFGRRRTLKTKNGRTSSAFHSGLDIAGGAGTEIRASADGCVSKQLTNRHGSWGLTVYIDHGKGMTTQYSHMKGFAPSVKVGQCFKRGDLIGYVGATGNCTGPHLHFGVYKNGKAVNPRNYLLARSNGDFSMTCSELTAFNQSLREQAPAFADAIEGRSGAPGYAQAAPAERQTTRQ